MNLLQEFKNDAAGLAILKDWLGDGGEAVSLAEAEARSAVCLQCPEHQPGKWWATHFKSPIAQAIKRQLAVKNITGMVLSSDGKLFMCRACGCALALKCWCPIEHIAAHTSPETLTHFPNFCWIRTEIERHK